MNIQEIIKRRSYGRTRIHYSNELIYDLDDLLKLNGLLPNKDDLLPIEFQKVKKIVSTLLNKGLAYPEEYMPIHEANEYSEYLLQGFKEMECQCFCNGAWDEYHKPSNGFGWNHMTNSTFDAGVIITSNDLHFCFWVEEED
ncbi:MAG: hypothetical protein AAFW00_28460 [Bacteroidota bacterium]